jgi:DNA invertase Pin-like site-specific DNA recombinase
MKDRTPKRPPAGPRLVGYARVSTEEQNLAMQISALVNAGVHPDNIWKEHVSAVAKKRPELTLAMADARKGDTFVVWKLDRLARDLGNLLEIMRHFDSAGVSFKSLTEGIDTSTPVGKLLLHVIGALAQFERDLVVERTKAGVKAHRERGGRIGQPKKIEGKTHDKVVRMIKAGKRVVEIAAEVGVTPTTIYNHFPKAVIAALREGEK